MRGSGEKEPPATLSSRISNRAPVLCLQLSSTPRFFTLHDQAPGSTSLPSFVSDAAIFPGPLLPKDCGWDLFRPSVERLTEQWPNKLWPNMVAPRNACWTVLLPVPRDYGQVPARPRKSSGNNVAAAFQGLWKITAHHTSETRLHL
ncbi:Hypothetical predicted protein, partial [Lynx pardinus]